MWRRAKEHESIFENFLHQAVASVGLEKVPRAPRGLCQPECSCALEREKLGTLKGSIHINGILTIAKQWSGRGELSSIVPTKCEVMMKTAVEGKVYFSNS